MYQFHFLLTHTVNLNNELLDCKEVHLLVGVWKSATTVPGAQWVIMVGNLLMLKLHADNLDIEQLDLVLLMD